MQINNAYMVFFSTSLSKMDSTLDWSPQKDFYNSISERNISKEDYLFAKKVWSKFKKTKLKELQSTSK
jgi:hypothetical protein